MNLIAISTNKMPFANPEHNVLLLSDPELDSHICQ